MCVVSIIVPIFNADQYLNRCIKSILSQSFSNFELILVNDGSMDGSGSICEDYAQIDKRVKVFHKKNGGPSSSRNLGIDKSSGDWIIFIDADDYVSNDYIENFFKYGQVDSYTQVIQGFHVFDNGGKIKKTNELISISHYEHTNIIPYNYNPIIEKYRLLHRTEVWGKLFSASIIRNNNIKFDERITVYEDGIFWHTYLLYINAIVLIPERCYYYYYPTSSSSLMHTHKHTVDEILSILEHTSTLQIELINKFALQGIYAQQIYNIFLNAYRHLYLRTRLSYIQAKRLQSIKPKHIKYVKSLKDICFSIINRFPLIWYLNLSRHIIK